MGLFSYIRKKREESFLKWVLKEADTLLPAKCKTYELGSKKKVRITRTIRGVVEYTVHNYRRNEGETKPYWHYTVYEYNLSTKEIREIRSGKYNFNG